ncbi:glycosyltransferase family 4 protein [Chloroflexota bacterium]
MKIALVSPYDYAYPGGVAYHISSLERQFTKAGHQVKVIAPSSKIIKGLDDRFIRIGRPWPIPARGTVPRIAISQTMSSKIKDVLEREQFDIVHLHEPFMPMLCVNVLRFSNTVNIGTFHAYEGSPGYDFGKPVTTAMLRRWSGRLDGRIAVSRPAMEYVSDYFPGEYTIIPNGVDLKHFSPDVAPINEYCDGKANVLFVGRLEKRKGLNYLLGAFQIIKKEVPESRLIVVGPGTVLRRRYEEWVNDRDIKDVVFTGQVSHDDLPRYYQTADIFCAPATGGESFGFVLLEAMSMGKPIIASKINGYASVLTDGSEGLLVPPREKARLAKSIVALLADKSLRQQMGERGRIKAQDYSWESVAQRILDYYYMVMNDFKGRKRTSFRQRVKNRLDNALLRSNNQ